MDTHLNKLQADIEVARSAYRTEREMLVKAAGWIFAAPLDAADAIEGMAEELGPSKAVDQLLLLPQHFGALGPSASDQVIADQSDGLESLLERMLDAQDQVDLLTRERDTLALKNEPDRPRVLNIAGREFAVDAGRNEVRSVDDQLERYSFATGADGSRSSATEGLSLTEQFARETGAVKAGTRPSRDRTRGR